MTESAIRALANLRDTSLFEWYVIPLLVFTIYAYQVEIAKKNWNVVLGALAFWGMDWFNEIWNALVLHFSGYAPVWGAPGKTAYLILVGLNIEISMMFAVAGIVACLALLPDKNDKIWGIPNRIFLAVSWSAFAVVVEMFLNSAGALTRDYSWWNRAMPTPIFLFGYLTFFIAAYYVHDLPTLKKKMTFLGLLYGVDLLALVVFGAVLKWI